MDMHTNTQFRDIADHHDDVVSFELSSRRTDSRDAKPVPTVCGDGWYHDAAVAAAAQDAIDARSNPYHH